LIYKEANIYPAIVNHLAKYEYALKNEGNVDIPGKIK
jgi:hypothetical protein